MRLSSIFVVHWVSTYILDNCGLPRFDCYAVVREKQTDTLVFVAFGQTRLPRKLDEKVPRSRANPQASKLSLSYKPKRKVRRNCPAR